MGEQDPIQQYIEAAQDLRQATREAHEAMRDLSYFIKEVRAIRKQIPESVAGYLDKAAKEGVDALDVSMKKAIKESETHIFKRFDTIASILTGDEEKAKGGENLEEQVHRMITSLSPVERKVLYARAKKVLGP